MRRFWDWVENESGERTLYLEGIISDTSWWEDEITPKQFREELYSGEGNVTVWIHSPGGDVYASAQIYNMLQEYKGDVTVKIDGIAASAASAIAMSGKVVLMSPLSLLMLHNPLSFAFGNSVEMKKTIDVLDEVKDALINAYVLKTGLSRKKISDLMDAETWLSAQKAVELGFADDIMYTKDENTNQENNFIFSRIDVANSLLNKIPQRKLENRGGISIKSLETRLNLLKH